MSTPSTTSPSTTSPSTTSPSTTTPSTALAFDALRRRLDGPLAIPGDDLYAQLVTPFNVAVASRPAAVVQARSAHDVVEAVRFAGDAGLAIAVQATGHGIAEDLEGALLIHTGALSQCEIDPEQRLARIGAGVRWQTVLDAAAPFGLAALSGSSPTVGVIGYTTGGGVGPFARTFGHTSDYVRAFEVVTGDGVLRRATATDEPDLFWALRGGKGALGIVTALELELLELPGFYGGALYFDGADAAAVLGAWRGWCAELPEQATTSVAILQLPAMPGVPEPLAGRMTIAVRFAWTGDAAEGQRLLAPIRAVAAPVLDAVGALPYAALAAVHADPVDPMPVHDVTDLLSDLPHEAIAALLAVAGPGTGSPQVVVELRQLGGALDRSPRTPDALCHRGAAFNLAVIGVLAPPIAAAVPAHAEAVRAALAPWATGGALPNFGAGTGSARLARSYDPPTLARLLALAEAYDPKRVLRAGQVPVRGPR